MNSQAADERALFEKTWLEETGKTGILDRDVRGDYTHAFIRGAWWAWRARAALAASVPVSREPCSPTLTECPRCKNDIAKCDGAFHPAAQSLPEPEPVSGNQAAPSLAELAGEKPLPEHLAAPSLLLARDSTESDRLPRGPGTPGQSPAAKAAAEAVHRWAAEMGTNAPAWVARKAELDFYDDGHGLGVTHGGRKTYGTEFLVWAREHMGQGYSLATDEGAFVDNVTAYCHRGYVAGKESMAQAEPSQQGCVQVAEASGSDSQSTVSVPLPEASGQDDSIKIDAAIRMVYGSPSELPPRDLMNLREFARALLSSIPTHHTGTAGSTTADASVLEALQMARGYVGVEGSDEEVAQIDDAIAKVTPAAPTQQGRDGGAV